MWGRVCLQAAAKASLTVLQGERGAVHRLALGWGSALEGGGGAGAGDAAAAEAGAQLQAPHVANHSRGIESLLQRQAGGRSVISRRTYFPSEHAHPPFAFGKVLPHLPADGLVDVLAEGRVSGDPGRSETRLFR